MKTRIAVGLLLCAGLLVLGRAEADTATGEQSFGGVTESRVRESLGDNWFVNGGQFTGEHYSPLSQINDTNVKELGLAWATDIPSVIGLTAEPIVVDGVIYTSGAFSLVFAVDAASGEMLWQFDPEVRVEFSPGNSVAARYNRGVAVWKGLVYVGTADCRVVAIDAAKGTQVWESPVCDPSEGEGAGVTGAPRVGGDKVFVGYVASDYQARGSLVALDAKNGELVWRFWTVPGHPSKGFENAALERASKTWAGGWAEKGGGAVWEEIRYDPVTRMVFFGTGTASPLNTKVRGYGDNLYGGSILAVDADTGEYRWHYQTVNADAWDYDAMSPLVVTDLEIDGAKRRVVLDAPKNGFFYVLDARTGELLSADAYAKVTWASHVNMKTGRPVVLPAANYFDHDEPGYAVRLYPQVAGAHNWHPMSYHPGTRLVYIPVIDMPTTYSGGGFFGGRVELLGPGPEEELEPGSGKLVAWDPVKRRPRWTVDHRLPVNGGVLSTAGNLVFQGTATGEFSAYAADTGRRLWSRKTGSSIQAQPVSYRLGEEQYVLASIGGKGGGYGLGARMRTEAPDAQGPPRLLAFKLEGKAEIPLPAPRQPAPVPKPPSRTASADQVDQGQLLFSDHGCDICHGSQVIGIGERKRGGVIPDLRYLPPEVHEEWHGILLGGNRRLQGMPSFTGKMSVEDAEAIHAYVIERSWQLYERSGDAAD